MDWSVLKERLIEAVAAASLLGGGGMVITNAVNDAKQDTRIEQIEELGPKLDKIADDVAETRETVARLETKMENTK